MIMMLCFVMVLDRCWWCFLERVVLVGFWCFGDRKVILYVFKFLLIIKFLLLMGWNWMFIFLFISKWCNLGCLGFFIIILVFEWINNWVVINNDCWELVVIRILLVCVVILCWGRNFVFNFLMSIGLFVLLLLVV